MIIRRLNDSDVLAISQESHADVAAQFAAHWGNDRFSRLEPFQSVLFGTVYHDSGHREMEADLPIDPATGLPYNFRGAPPEVRNRESDGLNALWIRQRDHYAALLVSMHHNGLRKRRYDTVSMTGGEISLGMEDAFADLAGWQLEAVDELGLADAKARRNFWHNYQALQVFDLMSLYLCCDGFKGEEPQPAMLRRVPVTPDSDERVDVTIEPLSRSELRLSPHPLDIAPFDVSVMARQLTVHQDEPPTMAQADFYRGRRRSLAWQIAA